MFDKIEFSNILKKINDTYSNLSQFAKKAGVDRSYLSKYINMTLDKAPSVEILKKIAEASNGETTYLQLMLICKYIDLETVFLLTNKNEETIYCDCNKKDFLEIGILQEDVDKLFKESHKDSNSQYNAILNVCNNYPETVQVKLLEKFLKLTMFMHDYVYPTPQKKFIEKYNELNFENKKIINDLVDFYLKKQNNEYKDN